VIIAKSFWKLRRTLPKRLSVKSNGRRLVMRLKSANSYCEKTRLKRALCCPNFSCLSSEHSSNSSQESGLPESGLCKSLPSPKRWSSVGDGLHVLGIAHGSYLGRFNVECIGTTSCLRVTKLRGGLRCIMALRMATL